MCISLLCVCRPAWQPVYMYPTHLIITSINFITFIYHRKPFCGFVPGGNDSAAIYTPALRPLKFPFPPTNSMGAALKCSFPMLNKRARLRPACQVFVKSCVIELGCCGGGQLAVPLDRPGIIWARGPACLSVRRSLCSVSQTSFFFVLCYSKGDDFVPCVPVVYISLLSRGPHVSGPSRVATAGILQVLLHPPRGVYAYSVFCPNRRLGVST